MLQERFASEKKNGKPVSFYFKQDINTPKEKVERALEIVKEAFLKQQATVGTDKAPFLLTAYMLNRWDMPLFAAGDPKRRTCPGL